MTVMKIRKCPNCGGSGTAGIFKLNDNSVTGYGYYWGKPPHKCELCEGSGKVELIPYKEKQKETISKEN